MYSNLNELELHPGRDSTPDKMMWSLRLRLPRQIEEFVMAALVSSQGSTQTPRRHLSCRTSNESCLLVPPKLYLSHLKTTNPVICYGTHLDLYNTLDDVSNKYVLVHFFFVEGKM